MCICMEVCLFSTIFQTYLEGEYKNCIKVNDFVFFLCMYFDREVHVRSSQTIVCILPLRICGAFYVFLYTVMLVGLLV